MDDRLRLDHLISMNETLFWKLISETADRMKVREHPTIFIHGFNTKFEDAVLRAAQIGYDLGIGQRIGLFSWPSKGSIIKYNADETMSEASKYLAQLVARTVKRVLAKERQKLQEDAEYVRGLRQQW